MEVCARPFVVTVASEKGGVGKTTIATNLAVYLKALREDLPVTIASFDNHFSIDHMFAIGGRRGGAVSALFAGVPAAELAGLGEYGVQFLGSERELHPPDDDVLHLRRALADSALPGLLILDTRPVLDYFTRNAVLAADLVLVPVKDRASLVNAAALQRVLADGGDPKRMWILPSLVDARLRLQGKIGVREFLVFAAGERGYQVLTTWIAKSPKVEGLATGFSARVRPVLTAGRGTVVHRQLRELAEFVLARFDAAPPQAGKGGGDREGQGCGICGDKERQGSEHPVEDLRGRRRGVVHAGCLAALLEGSDLPGFDGGSVLVLRVEGAGVCGAEPGASLHLCDDGGEEVASCLLEGAEAAPFVSLAAALTGRPPAELYREILLLGAPGRERTAAPRRLLLAEFLRR